MTNNINAGASNLKSTMMHFKWCKSL